MENESLDDGPLPSQGHRVTDRLRESSGADKQRHGHSFRPLDSRSRPDAGHDRTVRRGAAPRRLHQLRRSEEHTYELQSLMRLSYAVFCLKKNNTTTIQLNS